MGRCLLFLIVALLVGCAEETPPGDLRAASPVHWFSPADTVKARILGRELPSGEILWGRVDSAERAWLQTRGYEMTERYVDSTATYHFRAKTRRLRRWNPRWDEQTLMTERIYVRQPDREETLEKGRSRTRGADMWAIVVGSATDSSSAKALLKSRKEKLSATGLRVRLRVGRSRDTIRYRVVAGQFDSVSVRKAIASYSSVLPAGAWPLRLQKEGQTKGKQ